MHDVGLYLRDGEFLSENGERQVVGIEEHMAQVTRLCAESALNDDKEKTIPPVHTQSLTLLRGSWSVAIIGGDKICAASSISTSASIDGARRDGASSSTKGTALSRRRSAIEESTAKESATQLDADLRSLFAGPDIRRHTIGHKIHDRGTSRSGERRREPKFHSLLIGSHVTSSFQPFALLLQRNAFTTGDRPLHSAIFIQVQSFLDMHALDCAFLDSGCCGMARQREVLNNPIRTVYLTTNNQPTYERRVVLLTISRQDTMIFAF